MKNFIFIILFSFLFIACAEEQSAQIPASKMDAETKINYLVGKRYYQFQEGYTCNLDGETIESYVDYVEFYHADHPTRPLYYCVTENLCQLNKQNCYEITQNFIETLEFKDSLSHFKWKGRPYDQSDVNPYANK